MTRIFKEITAKFSFVGMWHGKEYHYDAIIKRFVSGAFHYGDRSAHTLELREHDTNKYLNEEYYDTRYEHISTYKPSWVKVWKNFIRRNWLDVKKVDLVEYQENETELED